MAEPIKCSWYGCSEPAVARFGRVAGAPVCGPHAEEIKEYIESKVKALLVEHRGT